MKSSTMSSRKNVTQSIENSTNVSIENVETDEFTTVDNDVEFWNTIPKSWIAIKIYIYGLNQNWIHKDGAASYKVSGRHLGRIKFNK